MALEMDLRGYGKTFAAASENLLEVMKMHIAFALFKGNPNLIFFPAEKVFWNV